MDKMIICKSDKHKMHNPEFEISDMKIQKYFENPKRIENIENTIKNSDIQISFSKVESCLEDILYNVHSIELINTIKNISKSVKEKEYIIPDTFSLKAFSKRKSKAFKSISYHCIDTSTPIGKHTYDIAVLSASIAYKASYHIIQNKQYVYGLCRPPGHHAGINTYGGYCYFNNAAIAANNLLNSGKVAILDLDYHHGNGTQEIFYEKDSVLYISIHADPDYEYPFFTGYSDEIGQSSGLNCNMNIPLPTNTVEKEYMKAMDKACEKILSFKPDFLIVSLGLDTYKSDPICSFKLEVDSYKKIGQKIKIMNYPTLILQEGGYCLEDLGNLVVSFLRGILSN